LNTAAFTGYSQHDISPAPAASLTRWNCNQTSPEQKICNWGFVWSTQEPANSPWV